MKKIISILIVMTMLFLSCGMGVSAVGNNAGEDALRKQFKEGDYIYDYYYYSPVKGSTDKTKYPVILWLHGQLSGEFKGDQVRESDVVYLASDENQAKIKGTGGAYVLVPRHPAINTNASLAWVSENANIKKFVDKFIAENKANIDTNRIYVGGYSMGGRAAIKFAASYSDFVAAAFPASSIYLLASADSDLKGLINTPTWFFTCKEDNFWGPPTPQSSDWNLLCGITNRKNDIRWTQFTRIDSKGTDVGLFNYDGSRIIMIGYNVHNVWDPVLHDLVMKSGSLYPNMTTVDGNNKVVNVTAENSFLSWLSSQSLNGVIEDNGGNSGSGDNQGSTDSGNSGGANSGSSGKTFYHVRDILEFIISLFDRVYKALFTVI